MLWLDASSTSGGFFVSRNQDGHNDKLISNQGKEFVEFCRIVFVIGITDEQDLMYKRTTKKIFFTLGKLLKKADNMSIAYFE